jgi:hypothetical protein
VTDFVISGYGAAVIELKTVLVSGLEATPRPRYSAAVAVIRKAGQTIGSATVGELVRYTDADGTPLGPELRRPATEGTIFDLAPVT